MVQETTAPAMGRPAQEAPIERARENARAGAQNVGEIERLASAVAGGALTLYGLSDFPDRVPFALLGGVLLYRGVSGHCSIYQSLGLTTAAGAKPAHIEHSMTIGVEPDELYAFWRDFTNLPTFMRHLEDVRVIDDKRSHWVAKAPAGLKVEWDAEIFMEKEGELIAWRSLPDAQVANAGSVRFKRAPGGRGTELKVVLEYVPPAGALGRVVARLLGEEPAQQVSDDLRRLKMVIEAGEVATSAMRPDQPKKEVA